MTDKELESLRLHTVPDAGQHADPADKDIIPDENYDPHLHRQVENPTSNFETLVHLLKCSLGTGILAMPQAFARSGLITGIIATIIIGIIITHCLHILVRAQYDLCKRKKVPLLTYPESMRVALEIGPKPLKKLASCAPYLVDFFLVVYQLGICCVYTVFIAKNAKEMFDPMYDMNLTYYMLIVLVFLIGANCIRNLKILAPFSSFANVLTIVGLGIVIYFLLIDKKSQKPLDYWGSPFTFPLFFGTTLFALTAVGVVIALENNMATPKDFGKRFGVLNIGMTVIVALYIAVGAIGYRFCVSECSDSITLDLPKQHWLAITSLVLFSGAILFSYVLQCYVPVEILWRTYTKPCLERRGYTKLLRWEYGLRITLCILTLTVPQLGLFISLFGALCLSALGMIFPAFMEICTLLPNKFGPCKYILFKDILLFIVGLIGMVLGTSTTVAEIVKTF